MPQTPEKWAGILSSVLRSATPRKRKALTSSLKDGYIELSPMAKKRKCVEKDLAGDMLPKLRKVKGGKNAVKQVIARKLIKGYSLRALTRATKLHRNTVSATLKAGEILSRNPRKDRVAIETVQQFYYRDDISREMPDKRYCTKAGPGFLMQITLGSTFQIFRREYPKIKIGLKKFMAIRPKNVRKLSLKHRRSCLCPYCANLKYKVMALNKIVHGKVEDERAFLNTLMCPREGTRFHAYECIFGKCKTCKDVKSTIYKDYQEVLALDTIVTWNHWERQVCEDNQVRRTMVTHKKGTAELICELVEDVTSPTKGVTMKEHVFVAAWQQNQFHQLKQTLPLQWVLLVLDFAKNRTVHYQDEIKSAYFGQRQMTMHPSVVYYRSKEGKLVRESHVFISDDIKHDHHAVNLFLQKSVEDIKTHLPEIHRIVIFTDGCSSQYKSKGPLADLSRSSIPTDHSYFGSEHGKSESDGETGVINMAADRAIVGRQVIINDALDMVKWATDNISSFKVSKWSGETFVRKFFHIGKDEINRNRPETDVKTVTGIRKFHQARNTGEPNRIMCRQLACYCTECRKDVPNWQHCENKNYVDPFMDKEIILNYFEEEAAPPSKKAAPPSKKAAPPSKKAAPPSKKAAPPSKKAVPPSKKAGPPSKKAAPPSKKAAPPSKKAAPASKKAAPASKKAAPPSKKAAPPSKKAAPPSKKAAPPSKKAAPPSKKAAPASKKAVPPSKKAATPSKEKGAPPSKETAEAPPTQNEYILQSPSNITSLLPNGESVELLKPSGELVEFTSYEHDECEQDVESIEPDVPQLTYIQFLSDLDDELDCNLNVLLVRIVHYFKSINYIITFSESTTTPCPMTSKIVKH